MNYSTVRVRPTLSDITVIRLSVLATLLTNRHDNTKQMVILCTCVAERRGKGLQIPIMQVRVLSRTPVLGYIQQTFS